MPRSNSQFTPVRTWGPFPSSSGGGSYIVQLNTSGIISCQCRGWAIYKKRPRECTHTRQVIAAEAFDVEARGQYFFLVDAKLAAAKKQFGRTPQEKFATLLAEYEAAANFMGSLPPERILEAAVQVEVAKYKLDSYLLLCESQGILVNAAN